MADTKQTEADRTGKMEALPDGSSLPEPPPPSASELELEADDILEVDGVPSLHADDARTETEDATLARPQVPSEAPAEDAAEERSEAPADRTMPMKRSDVVAAAAKAADLQELDYELPQVTQILPPTPAPPKTSPVLTSVVDAARMPGQNVIVAGSHHPPSVAPVAIDRTPLERTPTNALRVPPPPMKSPAVPIVVGGVLLAAILGIAGAAAGFALGSEPEKAEKAASPASSEPSPAKTADPPATVAAASPAPPPPAPSPDPAPAPPPPAKTGFSEGSSAQPAPTLDNLPSSDVSSLPSAPGRAAAPPPHVVAAAPPPEPRPEPRPAAPPPPKPAAPPARAAQAAPPPAPAAPAPQVTTGVIRVPISDSIVTIVVDGHFRRVNNGAVIVSCGPHSVRVGSTTAKDVNVPCGGSVGVD